MHYGRRHLARSKRCLFAVAISLPGLALAQPSADPPPEVVVPRGTAAVPNYVEYSKRLRTAEQVTSLGSELFGDTVSLYSGQTTFSQVDIDLPGNNALPVQLRRRYAITALVDNQMHDPRGGPGNPYGGAANWDIEVPHIYGVFDAIYKWNIPDGATTQQPRCSQPFNPKLSTSASLDDVWSGTKVSLPGQGEKQILRLNPDYGPMQYPSDGRLPTLTTSEFDAFACTTSATSSGEGFVMTTRAGITYTFDVYRERLYPTVVAGAFSNPRVAVFLLASSVRDRYGNTVSYQYNANGHPTAISASDGRSISLQYDPADPHRLKTATITLSVPAQTRTWTYSYEAPDPKRNSPARLIEVVLPDGVSKWTFDYTSLNTPDRYLYADYVPPDGSGKECIPSTITGPGGNFGLRMTHPAGARGEFRFKLEREDRTNIDPGMNCVVLPGGGRGLKIAPYIDSFRIKSKKLFHADDSFDEWIYNGAYVTQPDGSEVQHVFSTARGATEANSPPNLAIEGQLLEIRTVKNGVELRRQVNEYFTGADALGVFPGQPFPSRYGIGGGGDDPSAGSLRPLKSTTITQQGVTFKRTYTAFDVLGRPLTVERKSSVGASTLYSKTETTTYEDNRVTWLLDQVKRITDVTTPATPVIESENGFDAAGNIVSVSRFGRLDSTMTWNSDGTLATVTDGPNTTVLGPFKRGIPQSVTYQDLSSVSASIDDAGDIRAVTDENGFVTGYDYDSLRRLTAITYPTGDTVAWLPTTIQYQRVGTSGGVTGTHWRQTTSTGNARKVVDFDQRMRPVLTRDYDTANAATTDRYIRRRFDHANRETFVSYPAVSEAGTTAGAQTTYDALGRVIATQQDSELGVLGTSTVYANPFKTVFTNARGKVTSTTFQVFDEPDESAPVLIESPLGVTTTLARDRYGKPLTLTRSGNFDSSTVSAARHYVYDANQRLCKTLEPESGATVLAYNSADQVAWKASGQNLASTSLCQQASVAANQKVSYDYDGRERLLTTSYGDGSPNVVRTYTPDGLLKTSASDGSLWTLSYNKRRLLTSEVLKLDGSDYPFGYTHTPGGHVASMTYPDGSSVAYAPNALGEVTQVGNYVTLIRRHPNGALKSFRYGNGIQHTTEQNVRGLPSRSSDTGTAGVLDDRYSYDENANVTAITDDLPGAFTRTMTYDDRDRLITASNSGLWGGTHSFVYDPLDNLRRSVTPKYGDWTHHYNTATQRLERIAFTGGGANLFTYGYDARGRVTARTSTGAAQTFTVDLADRVTQAGPGFASYRYDGNGRRMRVTKGAIATPQVYSQAGQLLYQSNPNTNDGIFRNGFQVGDPSYGAGTGSSTRYIYLGRHLIAEDGAAGRRYIHTDGLGSPARTSGTDGVPSDRADYKPYGWGGPNQSKPDFTGHVADMETGLIYMQARYYDPFAGRFLAVDPVAANPASFNRYWYANNSPYKFIDPDGRWTCSDGGSGYCAKFESALNRVGDATKSIKLNLNERAQLKRVMDFYGNKGDGAVSVSFANLGGPGGSSTLRKDGGQHITLDFSRAQRPSENLTLNLLARAVAHEGQHGVDDQKRGRPMTSLAERKQTEISGYTAQALYQKAAGFAEAQGDGWTPYGGLNQENIERQAEASISTSCRGISEGSCK